ncbi:MobH family relaxase [Chromohalobacter israelensis]|uniref:MobH family relaxase n=1 Tax=Chromohalobacter israelensis TaxID=141390 RepID=UPI0009FD3FFB|nr:MobH family relaxase [Chromohalobacter israelensis]MDF9434610.1 TraI domain-containing protein [Chromohalobacter israelensis]
MLRRLFSRSTTISQAAEGFHTPRSGKELLATPRRQSMVKMLWDTTSLTQPVFNEYLLAPIERYAELVQLLPASESHHHAYAGGMLDHALEMACYGLRLRQRHLLPPGAKPEDQSSTGELWSAAIIYGALMHDVAKIIVDIEIHLQDGREWRVWHGVIPKPYRVRYRANREYHLHSAVNTLLGQQVLGGKVMDWLMSQPKLFSLFMYTISGHTERGGIIAELVHQADRASVAKALGGNPVQALSAPIESIQRKLAEGLRFLVKEQFKLNKRGGQAWLTDEALWLVSPRAINELKAHIYAQGIKSIPAELNRLQGEMHAHGIIEEVEEGKHVWKCNITDGDWQKTLNMIKVPPTLIWGVDERPSSFSGHLTVQGAGTVDEQQPPTGTAPQEKSTEPTSAVEQSTRDQTDTPTPAPAPAPAEVAATSSIASEAGAGSIDDDIMALFPEVNGEDKQDVTKEGSSSESETQLQEASESAKTTPLIQKSSEDANNSNDPADLGERFWEWLKMGLADHSIVINDTKAPVHTVNGTYFLVSPGIFKRFCNSVLNDKNQWQAVQKRFQKLGLHVRTQGQNIHKVSVEGQNKTGILMGYLIKDPVLVSQKIPPDNWVLTLVTTKGEKGVSDE